MTSLIACRATCLANYGSVNLHLRGSLLRLLSRFLPDPANFLHVLSPWGALIVGEAALSHLLRDPAICQAALEIAIGNLYFTPFIDCVSRLFPAGSLLTSVVVKPVPNGFPFHRHITRIAELRLASGLMVILYESSTPSACDVVGGYWTTALMNFVTGFGFGCAYPRLTLNRFTLLCDARSSYMGWWDHDMATQLELRNFHTDTRPDAWLSSSREQSAPSSPPVDVCGKSLYVCPMQGRYFGDPGSLIIFYDGFCVDLAKLRELGVAPYGPMVTWRLPSSGTCGGRCIELDPVMPPFVSSMITQFAEDNAGFPRAHVVSHTISDPDSRCPVISPPALRRRRRYSV
uniref:Zn(2)-C6 fungal-type domain-containing protein n=1 Tax=Ganoderma boninense TaxID=34458 RepID=A0A5K1JUJ7_9APHY|nr:Zn(2)-C6 fungal-type domain-containing protein [Ganoderma boninense]